MDYPNGKSHETKVQKILETILRQLINQSNNDLLNQ